MPDFLHYRHIKIKSPLKSNYQVDDYDGNTRANGDSTIGTKLRGDGSPGGQNVDFSYLSRIS